MTNSVIPQPAQPAQTEAKARRKAARAVVRSKTKQCSHCGRCWPFVVFPDHHTSHQCLRCSHPAREISRWTGIRNDMIQAAISARRQLQQEAENRLALQHQKVSLAAAHDLSILSEKQIEGVLTNLVGLRKVAEPARAAIWIQLNFRPFSTATVRQTTVYQSYLSFMANKSHTDPQPINGEEVIRLVERIWPGRVQVVGSPHYHLQGLEIRPSRMAYVLGTSGNSLTNANCTRNQNGRVDNNGRPNLDISAILTAAHGNGSISNNNTHFQVQHKATTSADSSNLVANASTGADPSRMIQSVSAQILPSSTSFAHGSSSAQPMSRRPSNNPPPPLIEAALMGKNRPPTEIPGHGDMVFGVSMQAAGSNDSNMSLWQSTSGSGEGEEESDGGDWDALRLQHRRPRMSKEHLDTIANGRMITKELSVQQRSRHSYSNYTSLASALIAPQLPSTTKPAPAENTDGSTSFEVKCQTRRVAMVGNDDDEEEDQLEEMI